MSVHPPLYPYSSAYKAKALTKTSADIMKQRRSQEPNNNVDRSAKRARANSVHTSERRMKVIDFDEVYQGGNAPIKHEIVRHPKKGGDWYIVRCDKHFPYTFMQGPIHKACRHIKSYDHDSQQGNRARVIEVFGVRVHGCTEQLAQRNNEAAMATWPKTNPKRPKGSATKPKRQKRYDLNVLPNVDDTEESDYDPPNRLVDSDVDDTFTYRNRKGSPIKDPQPGQIYLSYWRQSGRPFGAIVLPMINLELMGLDEDITSLFKDALKPVPNCYKIDQETGQCVWASGYENGGPRQAEQQYPVMWFDKEEFPGQFSWVNRAQEFYHFEEVSALSQGVSKPHMKVIKEYIGWRESQRPAHDHAGESQPFQDDQSPSRWRTVNNDGQDEKLDRGGNADARHYESTATMAPGPIFG